MSALQACGCAAPLRSPAGAPGHAQHESHTSYGEPLSASRQPEKSEPEEALPCSHASDITGSEDTPTGFYVNWFASSHRTSHVNICLVPSHAFAPHTGDQSLIAITATRCPRDEFMNETMFHRLGS